MKNLGMTLLVFLLFFLSRGKAQTASSTSPDKFYSSIVKQQIEAAQHPVHASERDSLPGDTAIPEKVKQVAGARRSSSSDKKDLPGNAAVDRQKLMERNKKYLINSASK